jgi:hypothetical protein
MTGNTPRSADVFAIPELLELILLSLPATTTQQELSSAIHGAASSETQYAFVHSAICPRISRHLQNQSQHGMKHPPLPHRFATTPTSPPSSSAADAGAAHGLSTAIVEPQCTLALRRRSSGATFSKSRGRSVRVCRLRGLGGRCLLRSRLLGRLGARIRRR